MAIRAPRQSHWGASFVGEASPTNVASGHPTKDERESLSTVNCLIAFPPIDRDTVDIESIQGSSYDKIN